MCEKSLGAESDRPDGEEMIVAATGALLVEGQTSLSEPGIDLLGRGIVMVDHLPFHVGGSDRGWERHDASIGSLQQISELAKDDRQAHRRSAVEGRLEGFGFGNLNREIEEA